MSNERTCDVCLGKKTVWFEGDDWVCPECDGTGRETPPNGADPKETP